MGLPLVNPEMSPDKVGARLPRRYGRRQVYVLDEPGRRLLMVRYDGTHERVVELATRLRVPTWRLKRWAGELGLARHTRGADWTAAEVIFLERNLTKRSIRWISRKLGRTETSVRLKAKRLGIRKSGEGYTMSGLCQALGCDHKKVQKWIALGYLKSSKRETERTEAQGGDMYLFRDRDIRTFLREHPAEIDPRRIAWEWTVSILSGTPTEVAV